MKPDAEGTMTESDAPVWARPEAFPPAPEGWGWQDRRGHLHAAADLAALIEAVADDRGARVDLVWTPERPHLVVPEEVPELFEPLQRVKRQWALDDDADAASRMKGAGLFAAAVAGWTFWTGGIEAVMRSGTLGVILLFGLIFGFIPWYQARKRLRALHVVAANRAAERIPELRFETWLSRQQAPATYGLLALMAAVGAVQLLPGETWAAAGLVKPLYAAGEWWRLLTAPWLHGHPIHWLMNAGALLYLGRRVETMARWPHLLIVFLFSAVIGGLATVAGNPQQPSIGASGGILGLLGFLLVFETLHRPLVPVSARRRLLAGLALTAFVGALAYRFIDNWAHAGGVVAGLAYAAIVFPKSGSVRRPRATQTDRLVGTACALTMIASAAWAIARMFAA